jgi:hypothetical protein
MGAEWYEEGCGIANAWIKGECREGVGYMPIYTERSQGMSLSIVIVSITCSEFSGQFSPIDHITSLSDHLPQSELIPRTTFYQ